MIVPFSMVKLSSKITGAPGVCAIFMCDEVVSFVLFCVAFFERAISQLTRPSANRSNSMIGSANLTLSILSLPLSRGPKATLASKAFKLAMSGEWLPGIFAKVMPSAISAGVGKRSIWTLPLIFRSRPVMLRISSWNKLKSNSSKGVAILVSSIY